MAKFTLQISETLRSYLNTAIWAELDNSYSLTDLSPEAMERAENNVSTFEDKAGSLLTGLDMNMVGHDLWLTQNGHGAGFWDGDYEDGEELTKIAQELTPIDVYVGDDGLIYFS